MNFNRFMDAFSRKKSGNTPGCDFKHMSHVHLGVLFGSPVKRLRCLWRYLLPPLKFSRKCGKNESVYHHQSLWHHLPVTVVEFDHIEPTWMQPLKMCFFVFVLPFGGRIPLSYPCLLFTFLDRNFGLSSTGPRCESNGYTTCLDLPVAYILKSSYKTPERNKKHRTWKWAPGKGDTFWKSAFFKSMLVFLRRLSAPGRLAAYFSGGFECLSIWPQGSQIHQTLIKNTSPKHAMMYCITFSTQQELIK